MGQTVHDLGSIQPPNGAAAEAARVRRLLQDVTDPEIPVLTIGDLGLIRDIAVKGEVVTVTITPTYSGCPAMLTIEIDIRDRLLRAGFAEVRVETVLAPAWTTDWLSEEGRRKLRDYGIAPPVKGADAAGKAALFGEGPNVACPLCGAADTERVSEFGSTACKALYRCRSCAEMFDYFKCI